MLLYTLPGQKQTFSPAPSAVARDIIQPLCLSFPHRYLLDIQAPGRFISLTPYLPGCKIPKTQETDSSTQCALLCIAQFSFQPDELQGKEEPSGSSAMSISSPSSPGFTPHAGQQLLPVFLHWEQAPAQTKAEGCDCSVPSHLQKDPPLHHCQHWGPSLANRPITHKTQLKKRAVLLDEIHPLFSMQQKARAFQEQVRGVKQPRPPRGRSALLPALRCLQNSTCLSQHCCFSVCQPPR